jgi:DNA-binding NarL/FixJ family response regulator
MQSAENAQHCAPVSVAIVEDHLGTREALVTIITRQPAFRCVGAYASGEDATRGILAEKPDVAIIDINLPGMSGIECVSRLRSSLPGLAVLMLTTYDDSELIFDSLRAGARGYLLKKNARTELIPAVEQVHAGGAPMSMQVARKVVDHFAGVLPSNRSAQRLTPREHEIMALLAKGQLDKQIADTLAISLATVRSHLRQVYRKLHVQSRVEAALKFLGR